MASEVRPRRAAVPVIANLMGLHAATRRRATLLIDMCTKYGIELTRRCVLISIFIPATRVLNVRVCMPALVMRHAPRLAPRECVPSSRHRLARAISTSSRSSAGSRASGHCVGASHGEASGSSCTSRKRPSTPTATTARAT